MNSILKNQIPEEKMRDVTYCKLVYNIRLEKDKEHRTRLVIGGKRINYLRDMEPKL